MDFQFISFDISEGIATITLRRPEVLNSFNERMAMELQEAIRKCAIHDEVRAVVLTGEGRGFCAGQDLSEVLKSEANPDPKGIAEIVREHYNPIVLGIRDLEKPVICAVNGVAAGAGANLALCCDFVFAANTVNFVQAFSKIGLVPDTGGTFFLPRLVGIAQATRMMYLGEKVSADEALRLGMIYAVSEPESLMNDAKAFALKLAQEPTKAFGYTKALLNASYNNSLDAQLELEAKYQEMAGDTADHKEGVNAFLQKRKPEYKGQ